MYKCRYFTINELVPKELLSYNEDLLWMLFDDRLLRLADMIRELYGPVYINTSQLNNCGFRIDYNGIGKKDDSVGAELSQHKLGRALDLHIVSIENKQLSKEDKITEYNKVRSELLDIEDFDLLKFEINIHWLHIDVRNSSIRTFKP